MSETDRFLTTKEAMDYLGVSWSAIYRYIRSGKLKAHRMGLSEAKKDKRHWRIRLSDLDAFVESNGAEGAK